MKGTPKLLLRIKRKSEAHSVRIRCSRTPRIGITYAKTLPFVDANRVVAAGCSFGGIQSLLAAERGGKNGILSHSIKRKSEANSDGLPEPFALTRPRLLAQHARNQRFVRHAGFSLRVV